MTTRQVLLIAMLAAALASGCDNDDGPEPVMLNNTAVEDMGMVVEDMAPLDECEVAQFCEEQNLSFAVLLQLNGPTGGPVTEFSGSVTLQGSAGERTVQVDCPGPPPEGAEYQCGLDEQDPRFDKGAELVLFNDLFAPSGSARLSAPNGGTSIMFDGGFVLNEFSVPSIPNTIPGPDNCAVDCFYLMNSDLPLQLR